VVLVHGAWHGAWCWDEVVSRLSGDGLDVVAVDLPSVASGGDLYDDARTVRQVLDDTPGEKVVVGHSYGGIVITEASAGAEGVRHLVYLTAFMLDEGADKTAAKDRVDDVARWLVRREISASSIATKALVGVTDRLTLLAQDEGAGIIVAGAYGHTRFQEWVFGGVTQDLLTQDKCCALLSH